MSHLHWIIGEYIEWALRTFPDESLLGQALHLGEEVQELEDAWRAPAVSTACMPHSGKGDGRPDPLCPRCQHVSALAGTSQQACLEEAVDVLFLASLISHRIRMQYTNSELEVAAKAKLAVNKTRLWERGPDGYYRHVREEQK
jgi:hypothetical protein